MREQILKAFMAWYPSLKQKQAEKCVDRYIAVMLRGIATSIANFGKENDEISLPITKLREEIKKVSINGKQQWVTDLMHKDNRMSLVIVNFKGNQGKNSRVALNPIYEHQIMNSILNLSYELSPKRLQELKAQANINIPVDRASLEDYIEKTCETYAAVENDASVSFHYKDALARNVLVASQLKEQIIVDEGIEYLPEYWEATDSGRHYGHGLSLQRVPKAVRNAALGICHQYDFKASSFGMMTSLALQIDASLKVGDLVDYIKNRDPIRKRIATEVGITEKRIKDIFTSLGFGASTANNPFTSIRGKLSSEQYEALMANVEFKHIRSALDLVRATVAEYYKSDDFELLGRKYDPIDPNSDPLNPKKRSKNQKLAWIYQVMESDAITRFGQAAQDSGNDPLLFAHDCVYFTRKLPVTVLDDIMYELNKDYPMLRVEYQEIIPIFKNGGKSKEWLAYDEMVEEHKKLIDAEELAAGFDKTVDELEPMFGPFAAELFELNDRVPMNIGKTFNSRAC